MQCLLDNLLAAEDEAGNGMSDKALRDELMTLLIAGQETSAIVLGWTCSFLAEHPVHQERALQEIGQKIGNRPVTSESIRFVACCLYCILACKLYPKKILFLLVVTCALMFIVHKHTYIRHWKLLSVKSLLYSKNCITGSETVHRNLSSDSTFVPQDRVHSWPAIYLQSNSGMVYSTLITSGKIQHQRWHVKSQQYLCINAYVKVWDEDSITCLHMVYSKGHLLESHISLQDSIESRLGWKLPLNWLKSQGALATFFTINFRTNKQDVCSELHFLEAVVLESMRLRPPAYMVGRCVKELVSVSSYTLTPGMPISACQRIGPSCNLHICVANSRWTCPLRPNFESRLVQGIPELKTLQHASMLWTHSFRSPLWERSEGKEDGFFTHHILILLLSSNHVYSCFLFNLLQCYSNMISQIIQHCRMLPYRRNYNTDQSLPHA